MSHPKCDRTSGGISGLKCLSLICFGASLLFVSVRQMRTRVTSQNSMWWRSEKRSTFRYSNPMESSRSEQIRSRTTTKHSSGWSMKLGAIANISVEKQDGYRLSGQKTPREGGGAGRGLWVVTVRAQHGR